MVGLNVSGNSSRPPAKVDKMYVVERLAGFAESFRCKLLPPLVLHHAKRAVIDWYAALLPGAVVAAGDAARTRSRGRTRPRRSAARAGPTRDRAGGGADQRRGCAHGGGRRHLPRRHLPPGRADHRRRARARAGARRIGEQFLRAVIVGYEISTRIGAAMGRAHYRYWHNTGTIGCFGACAAAARAAAAGREALRARAGDGRRRSLPACSRRSAWTRCPSRCMRGAPRRPASPRRSPRREGVTGSLDVIEGECGLRPRDGRRPGLGASASRRLGKTSTSRRMTFKNHACCGHTFAAIDGALALQAQHEASRARHRARPRRHLPRGAGGGGLRIAATRRRRRASRSSTWSRPRSRTAACASPPSSRRA